MKNVAGKIWNLPNTIVGLAVGGTGYALGNIGYALGLKDARPTWSIGNNAIQFHNNPFTSTAMTLGNTMLYNSAPQFQSGSRRGNHTLGYEEMQHTYQGEALGIFYLPAHVVLGTVAMVRHGDFSSFNAMIHGWQKTNETPMIKEAHLA